MFNMFSSTGATRDLNQTTCNYDCDVVSKGDAAGLQVQPLASGKKILKHYEIKDTAVDWYRRYSFKFRPLRQHKQARKNYRWKPMRWQRISPEFLGLLLEHQPNYLAQAMSRRCLDRKPSLSYYKFAVNAKHRHVRPGVDTTAPLDFPAGSVLDSNFFHPTEHDVTDDERSLEENYEPIRNDNDTGSTSRKKRFYNIAKHLVQPQKNIEHKNKKVFSRTECPPGHARFRQDPRTVYYEQSPFYQVIKNNQHPAVRRNRRIHRTRCKPPDTCDSMTRTELSEDSLIIKQNSNENQIIEEKPKVERKLNKISGMVHGFYDACVATYRKAFPIKHKKRNKKKEILRIKKPVKKSPKPYCYLWSSVDEDIRAAEKERLAELACRRNQRSAASREKPFCYLWSHPKFDLRQQCKDSLVKYEKETLKEKRRKLHHCFLWSENEHLLAKRELKQMEKMEKKKNNDYLRGKEQRKCYVWSPSNDDYKQFYGSDSEWSEEESSVSSDGVVSLLSCTNEWDNGGTERQLPVRRSKTSRQSKLYDRSNLNLIYSTSEQQLKKPGKAKKNSSASFLKKLKGLRNSTYSKAANSESVQSLPQKISRCLRHSGERQLGYMWAQSNDMQNTSRSISRMSLAPNERGLQNYNHTATELESKTETATDNKPMFNLKSKSRSRNKMHNSRKSLRIERKKQQISNVYYDSIRRNKKVEKVKRIEKPKRRRVKMQRKHTPGNQKFSYKNLDSENDGDGEYDVADDNNNEYYDKLTNPTARNLTSNKHWRIGNIKRRLDNNFAVSSSATIKSNRKMNRINYSSYNENETSANSLSDSVATARYPCLSEKRRKHKDDRKWAAARRANRHKQNPIEHLFTTRAPVFDLPSRDPYIIVSRNKHFYNKDDDRNYWQIVEETSPEMYNNKYRWNYYVKSNEVKQHNHSVKIDRKHSLKTAYVSHPKQRVEYLSDDSERCYSRVPSRNYDVHEYRSNCINAECHCEFKNMYISSDHNNEEQQASLFNMSKTSL